MNKKSKDKKEKGKKSEGIADSVIQGLGKIIPPLGNLIQSLEKSDVFKERLGTINKEVERKLKEAPLKKIERTIIPPKTTFRGKRPSLEREEPVLKRQKDIIVDIFDEEECIKIIAELPGVEKKDIKTKVEGSLLTISAKSSFREYYKEVTLPCLVKEEIGLVYKNGILQIKLEKRKERR